MSALEAVDGLLFVLSIFVVMLGIAALGCLTIKLRLWRGFT